MVMGAFPEFPVFSAGGNCNMSAYVDYTLEFPVGRKFPVGWRVYGMSKSSRLPGAICYSKILLREKGFQIKMSTIFKLKMKK